MLTQNACSQASFNFSISICEKAKCGLSDISQELAGFTAAALSSAVFAHGVKRQHSLI